MAKLLGKNNFFLAQIIQKTKFYCLEMFRIPQARFIWDTLEIILLAMF